MAHTKSKGTSKLGRDSVSKRRGVKLYAGQAVRSGQIIVRQLGDPIKAGKGTRKGGDDTIYAAISGKVAFSTTRKMNYDGRRSRHKVVSVVPAA